MNFSQRRLFVTSLPEQKEVKIVIDGKTFLVSIEEWSYAISRAKDEAPK